MIISIENQSYIYFCKLVYNTFQKYIPVASKAGSLVQLSSHALPSLHPCIWQLPFLSLLRQKDLTFCILHLEMLLTLASHKEIRGAHFSSIMSNKWQFLFQDVAFHNKDDWYHLLPLSLEASDWRSLSVAVVKDQAISLMLCSQKSVMYCCCKAWALVSC